MSTWELLNAYKYEHSQILIDECTGDGVQAISIFESQCANITLDDQSRYNDYFFSAIGAQKKGVNNQLYQNISECSGFGNFSRKTLN